MCLCGGQKATGRNGFCSPVALAAAEHFLPCCLYNGFNVPSPFASEHPLVRVLDSHYRKNGSRPGRTRGAGWETFKSALNSLSEITSLSEDG